LFGSEFAFVTLLSGNLSDLAVLFAFTVPEDKIVMLPFTASGYPLGLEKFNRKRVPLRVNRKTMEIDWESSAVIEKVC
jgi:glycine/serine hydroxymethyltransferase